MARIYPQTYVEEIFRKENCKLIGLYTGIEDKVEFICSCNKKDEITLKKFKSGKRCESCNALEKKNRVKGKAFTYEFIKEFFESKNCVLLEEFYKNGTQPLRFICSCGSESVTKFRDFSRGSGVCEKCARQQADEARKIADNEIIENFKERGCEVLEIEKKGNNYFVTYICHCGSKVNGYYTNFLRGHDCTECKRRKFQREKHFNWNPNLTDDERENERMIEGYEQWRDSVYERDAYACQCCGIKGGRLCAHHKNNYANFPEQRIETENGVTLCEECHVEFHSIYSYKNNTKEQYDEFESFKRQSISFPVSKTDYEFKEMPEYASRYRGVRIDKGARKKKWVAVLSYNNNAIYLGHFYTEMEAAAAYNLKAIELFGKDKAKHRLNDVEHENMEFQKTITSSQYKGVSKKSSGKWGVTIWIKGECKFFGTHSTEEEAAMVYNLKVLKYLGDGVELNPVDHTKYVPPMRSRFFGVYYEKRSNKYRAILTHNKVRYSAGYFEDEVEAAKAYDKKVLEILGDTKKLNFPVES